MLTVRKIETFVLLFQEKGQYVEDDGGIEIEMKKMGFVNLFFSFELAYRGKYFWPRYLGPCRGSWVIV